MSAALLTTTLSFIFRNCPIYLTLWIMMNMKCWVFIPNLKVYLTIWNTSGLKRNPLLIHLTGNFSINVDTLHCHLVLICFLCHLLVTGLLLPGPVELRHAALRGLLPTDPRHHLLVPQGLLRSGRRRGWLDGQSTNNILSLLFKTFRHGFIVRTLGIINLEVSKLESSSNKF